MDNKNIPRKPHIEKWEKYLNRKLTNKEKILLRNTECEMDINKDIMNLAINLKNDKLYIPCLSISDGNCLYESLNYHLKENNLLDIRINISNFMKLFKNYKNLFINQDLTLNDMFTFQNEIPYLLDKTTDILYDYTYDVMCSDLQCDGSWHRLPVELILMCVSYLYDIKIIICHDNGFMHDICTSENINNNIYIGLLGEFHYIPLDIKKDEDPDDITDNVPIYNKFIDKYHTWKKEQKK